MPSFDITSEIDQQEIRNGVDQAGREVANRFDFKGTDAELEKTEAGIVVRANSEERVRAALDVFQGKLVRRKVSLKHLDVGEPEPGPKGSQKLLVKVKEGIEQDKAKTIVKMIKDQKFKVQASIHEQSVRVSGKKRDDLQDVIAFLRKADELELDLSFENFRD